MALDNIRKLLEDRLRDLVPTESLEPGSRAQVDFIEPILLKLGSDPIETPIEEFIDDRFAQEYPDIFQGSPSFVRDIFSKPLRTLLEPFKREIQGFRINQSLKNPALLSDDDADALVANVFDERPAGGFATGTGRLYFNNPTTVSAEITSRFYTADGLNFFPISPVSITAEEMVFNRDGTLFFFDILVRAEKAGSEYNIGINALANVEGIGGVLKVGNPRDFEDGSSTLDTAAFVAQATESLSERSLVTRRGATARINHDFSGQVRAIQVIGAKDPEMQRDLLVAASPGHAWLTGPVNLYKQAAYVRCRTVEGDPSNDVVNVGDTLYVYLPASTYPALLDNSRFVRLTVTKVLSGPLNDTAPYRISYLVQFAGTLPVAVTGPITLEGGFAKKGTVQINSIPDTGSVNLTANNGEIHVYGHSDIYVRPVLQTTSKALLSSVNDYKSVIEQETLVTNGAAVSNKNLLTDSAGVDFGALGISIGDLVTIEQGSDAGTYTVGAVQGTSLYLTTNLSASASGLRYRVMKKVRIDPFEPKVPKFPFGTKLANDLATTIGSTKMVLTTNDLLLYGAKVGDTVRIKTGLDAGDFTITAFDSVLGGRGIIVDRPAQSSNSSLSYEVFTALDKLVKPLVRVKSIELLDSSSQSTGITIPPADPVAVMPTSDFTTAKVRGASSRRSGYVLPDLAPLIASGLIPNVSVAATSGDRRYSLGIDVAQGNYRSTLSADGYKAELDFRTDSQGACSYFLAVAEGSGDPVNLPPVDPKVGECLTIKSGPNAGSYLIRNVYKFKFHDASANVVQCYFIQIFGAFPVDAFGQLLSFLQSAGGAAVPTAIAGAGDISFPTFFQNFRDGLGANLNTAFTTFGASSPGAAVLQQMVLDQVQADYEWGDPARGVLRTYVQEPTLFEQWTSEHNPVTLYSFKTPTGEVVKFRPYSNNYSSAVLVPSRLSSDVDPASLPRDLDAAVAGAATFTDTTKPSPYSIGVVAGDFVSVHQEIFFPTSNKVTPLSVQTVKGSTVLTAPAAALSPFTPSLVGSLISIETGADKGMYRVVKYIDPSNIQVDRLMTVTTTPATLVPVRVYEGTPHEFPVTGFPTNNPAAFTLNVSGTIFDGFNQPYQISRPNVRRITPTEMSVNQDGAYFYFDTEVVSLVPHEGANLSKDSYLTIDPGTFKSIGYRHVVADKTLTYSMDEAGWLDLPLQILPVGSIDRSDSYLNVVGSPVLIQYERADIVQEIQDFVDSPLDRVTVANTLVRHFLPQYVSYDATYSGGSSPGTIAKKIIDRINGLAVETPIDVSEDLQKIITNASGNPETPTKVMLLTHDWSRQRWLEMSENKIGGTTTKVPYDGTPRVAYFVPGPDVSTQNTLPAGERINLVRGN